MTSLDDKSVRAFPLRNPRLLASGGLPRGARAPGCRPLDGPGTRVSAQRNPMAGMSCRCLQGETGNYLFKVEPYPGGPQGHSVMTASSQLIGVIELPRHGCPPSRFTCSPLPRDSLLVRVVPGQEIHSRTDSRLRRNHAARLPLYHARYDSANQLSTSRDATGTTTYSFDRAGNLQVVQTPASARTSYTWDNENRNTQLQLADNSLVTMSYRFDGLRVRKDSGAVVTKFIYDGQNELAETDGSNTINRVLTQEPAGYGNLVSQRVKSAPSGRPTTTTSTRWARRAR